MKKPLFAALIALASGLWSSVALSAMPAGNLEAGRALAGACMACHGMDGNSASGAFPKIAGQHPRYIYRQLQQYKSGQRVNALMAGVAAGLSDQDMANLAAYFSSQKMSPGAADPALAARGERLYRGGNSATGLAACAGCHGPAGKGNSGAAYPRLGGQWAEYTKQQLVYFRAAGRGDQTENKRWNNGANSDHGPMQMIAARLSDDDIDALSAYIQGLR